MREKISKAEHSLEFAKPSSSTSAELNCLFSNLYIHLFTSFLYPHSMKLSQITSSSITNAIPETDQSGDLQQFEYEITPQVRVLARSVGVGCQRDTKLLTAGRKMTISIQQKGLQSTDVCSRLTSGANYLKLTNVHIQIQIDTVASSPTLKSDLSYN